MSVLTNVLPTPQPRIRRKPAPSLELDARYPRPDPDDPFAPLSVLRSRTASTLGAISPPPLTFRGTSTSHLPTLSYTGGRYPPDIYQAYLNPQPSAVATANFELSSDKLSGVTKWLSPASPVDPHPSLRFSPQRRRSQSAMSRKEARATSAARTSSSFHSYVLVGARSSTPTLVPAFTTEPLSMSPESSAGDRSESSHGNASRHTVRVGGMTSMPSSQVHLPSSLEDATLSSKKGRKLARFLPKRAVGRLSLGHKSTDTLALPPPGPSAPFPQRAGGRLTRGKQMSEENTFHARRKSTALFPAAVAASLHMIDVSSPVNVTSGTLICELLTDADLGYLSDSAAPPSRPRISPEPPARVAHFRSQTMDGHLRSIPKYLQDRSESLQPLTAPVPPYSAFDEHAMPTSKQLMDAASCVVIAENGIRVPFSDILKDKKTIVIFIRHFWCAMCQDYMFSLSSTVDPKLLKQANTNLVVIGNGSFNMIKSYRQIFHTPFAIYTDPSMRLYSALGMMNPGKTSAKSQIKRGSYVRHGNMSGLAMVVANAVRVGMPIWEKGGDPAQLGGEFVFGPGMTVSFAHRMPNAGCHAPIQRVLAAAGVGLSCEKPLPIPGPVRQTSAYERNDEQWMEERRMSLARIRERKIARRKGVTFPARPEPNSVECRSPLLTDGPPAPSNSPNVDEKQAGSDAETASPTDTSNSRSRYSDDHAVSVEDTDVETVSMGSRTLTESDSASERTRTEEAEPRNLQDKAALLDLDDLDTQPASMTVSS
ncbi:AhpC/TSA antioxidant enzyme-domain-containing protein [Scleroderma yunnanense]